MQPFYFILCNVVNDVQGMFGWKEMEGDEGEGLGGMTFRVYLSAAFGIYML